MATLYYPRFEIKINGFDISKTIAPYLVSITIEEVFNTSFTPTKLELIFHSKYTRSTAWQYKDTITVKLWWEPLILFVYQSPTFYVDYIDDIKNGGGDQLFRVSALAADPSLGFTYGFNQLTYTNTTISTAVTNFASAFGLTLVQNFASNVYLGTIKDINNINPPDVNLCRISFNSYADMLKYICDTYGYYGDLRGTTLRMFDIGTAVSDVTRFYIWDFGEIFGFNAKQSYTQLYKEYNIFYINRDNANAYSIALSRPTPYTQLNNKVDNIDFNDAYNNIESATRRLRARILQDYLEGFEVTINSSGLPEFTAGNVFLLNPDYGSHAGFYRCTKCIHRVDGSNGWISELTGYPISKVSADFATFTVAYLGNTRLPDPKDTLTISTNIKGTLSLLTGTQLDQYAKALNPNYNQNLGNTFITEGNKSGNKIRADIAFCIALYETVNFTNKDLLDTFNPLFIGTVDNLNIPFNYINWANGVRGGIQHLYAFATPGTTPPADPIIDPRFNYVTRGSATTVDALQGKWTNNLDFSRFIKALMFGLYSKFYPKKTIDIS